MLFRWIHFRLAALLLFAWVLVLAVVIWLVFEGRSVALESGERATAAFAQLVERQTLRTFQAVNLTLAALNDAHQLSPRPVKHDAQFQQMMKHRLADVPFVRALFVIGEDGWIVHDTDYPSTPFVSLADRPYFQAHQKDEAHAVSVWPPLLSRSGTGWFVPVTRRLGRSGRFEGLIVAALQADHFRETFRDAELPASYQIALFHLDGTLVASHPASQEHAGKRFAELPVFTRHLSARSGTFWSVESMLPGERVVSYRVVQDLPLVVQVSRARSDVLGEWQRTATAAAVAMAALTLFLGWVIARYLRERARWERESSRRMQAEKLEALGRLTGGIAHDVRNLLGVVAMNIAVLRRSSDPAVGARALDVMDRAVDGGRRMIERLLSFAQDRPLAVARMRIDSWLDAARPLLEQAAGSRITLTFEVAPGLPEVLCDSAGLDSAVLNLVVNARDAMDGCGQIVLRAFQCDDEGAASLAFVKRAKPYVCLSVQDNGPGMTEEVKRRALEPFYTTKGEAGTGLGLSQVYGFMQQLGGTLRIDSDPQRGTVVHLFLPIAPANP